jgi:antitoxin CptB
MLALYPKSTMTLDEIETRRRRLNYLSQRRGTKEADLVLGGFADRYLATMNQQQLTQFEALLQEPDPDLLIWVGGLEAPPEHHRTDLFDLLMDFKKTLASH